MKKTSVCVVTLYKHNYGAFLQAYGLQKYLESMDFDARVLDYDYFKDHAVLGISLSRLRQPVHFAKAVLYRALRQSVSKQRDEILERCASERLHQTKYYKTYKAVKADPPVDDIYITGSDQVWNPTISEQGFASRLLEFAPQKENVICSYAASVGVPGFSNEVKASVRENLKRFDCISVREPASEKVIQDLTDKQIVLHKDPALILNAAEWGKFAVKIETDQPYIFLYLAQRDPELIKYATEMAARMNMRIVDCHGSVNYTVANCVNGSRVLSPMEFVGGIQNAAYVVTNSFHCLVFSIHFKKKAYVRMPEKGAGRLSELIANMSLQRLTAPDCIADGEEAEIYQHSDAYLAAEREHASEYFNQLREILRRKRNEE